MLTIIWTHDTPESLLDYSNLVSNSWFTGFTTSDIIFGIKFVEKKSKPYTLKDLLV